MEINAEQGGPKRLNESFLKPGDIILTTTTKPISKGIRLVTKSDISHAMVYVSNRSIIDATGEGVHSRNTQRLFFDKECSVHALRLRAGISNDQLNAVISFMRGHIGTQYSTKEAILTVIGCAKKPSKKQFCSRLVAQAFSSANIQLVNNPNFCSPADLKKSQLLITVQESTIPVTAKEAAYWEGNENIPQLMRDSTNSILDAARQKDSNIQTFDDLHRYLVSHPDEDLDFCKSLEASGYLNVWKIEMEKNAWQYDLKLMCTKPANIIDSYCRQVLENEQSGPNRFEVNRGGYMLFSRQHKLQYFQLMLNLYDHLSDIHRLRVEVATQWLAANGSLTQLRPSYLIPHTPEWFVALAKWDPPKAMMVQMIIDDIGRNDICSVCGDDPANDYYLEEIHRQAGGVNTLRLCDDCLKIRHNYGEPFIKLPK